MAGDMFLKIDGIDGESGDDTHKGEIDIDSFSFGITQDGTMNRGGGGGAGKASFSDFSFAKLADKASPALMQACAKGDHIAHALLTVRKAGGKQEEFYKIKFSDILISSVHNNNATGGAPSESVTINFAKIEFDYKDQNTKGALGGVVKFGWDVKKNVKI